MTTTHHTGMGLQERGRKDGGGAEGTHVHAPSQCALPALPHGRPPPWARPMGGDSRGNTPRALKDE